MTIPNLPPFYLPGYPVQPLPDVVPFTARSGATFAEVFYGYRDYVDNTLIPAMNKNSVDLVNALNVIAKAVIDEGIELSTEIMESVASDNSSPFIAILNNLYAGKSVETTVAEVVSQLTDLGDDIDADGVRITANENQITNTKSRVTVLENDLNLPNTGIKAKVLANETSISSQTNRIATLESKLGVGNLVSAIGDSVTAGEGNNYIVGGYSTAIGDSPLGYAYAASDGRFRILTIAGVGGQRSDQILSRLQNEVISPGANVCVINSFYWNNIGQGRTVAQTVSDLDAMFTLLRAAGVQPIVCLPTPDGTQGSSAARRLLRFQMANAVSILCRQRGVNVVDPFPVLVDVNTGVMSTAYDKDGTVHPLPAGYKAFGNLINAAIERVVASGPAPEAMTAIDPTDLLGGKGLFLTDTSGVGTGWTAGADASWSIVTDAAVKGRMQQVSVNNGSSYKDMRIGAVGTEFNVNDVLELSGIITNSGGSAVPRVRFLVGGVGNPYITFEPKGQITRGKFAMRWVVPSGATTLDLRFQMQNGTGIAAIGQVAVRKL